MKKRDNLPKLIVLILLLMPVILNACGPSEDDIAKAIEETQAAEELKLTESAETEEADAEDTAKQTADALEATQQFDQALTATSEAEATEMWEMINALGTESAAQMSTQILDLFNEGYLGKTEGAYFTVSDFDESWAQINWYQWWQTGYAPEDFVIRADASWDSASDTANWFSSGCGFVFREDGPENHYLAYLGLDGNVYFARSVRNNWSLLGTSWYGRVDVPSGEAEIVLIAEGDRFTFLVNGKRVANRVDGSLAQGNLALTLLSGTNAGYGTRCQMTNIELWVLD
ncbi:MAG: hypothetical protein GTO14_19620 [Anaerolineales bacterium]|nr:hypothetical protein [Anaerolineales bacterium]